MGKKNEIDVGEILVLKFVNSIMKFVFKILLFSVVVFFFSNPSLGQNTRLFLKTDFGLSSMNFKPDISVSNEFGYGVGLEYKIELTERSLSLNPAVSFIRTAFSIPNANKSNAKVVASYLKLDLPLVLRIYQGHPSHLVFFGVGPFFALPVSGHYSDSLTIRKMKFGDNAPANRKAMDAGLVFRLSISHFPFRSALMSVQYNYGLLNLVPQNTLPEMKMCSRNIYLSFLIPITWAGF